MAYLKITMSEESARTIERSHKRATGLVRKLRPIVDQAAAELASDISEHELHGKTLNVVTGMLARSVTHRVRIGGDGLLVAVGVTRGPASKYAAIHERGGEIRPKRAKYLAIPLQRTGGGRPKFPGGPRSVKGNTFVYKSKKGNLFIVRARRVRGKRKGKVKTLEFLFLLRKSVKIPPRRWLSGGVQRHVPAFEVKLQKELDRILGAA